MSKRNLVARHRDAILALAATHELMDVRLFGSAARGDEHGASDVDMFVKRRPGSDPWLLYDFQDAVQALLGCRVDVIADAPLMRPRVRSAIQRDAVPV